MKMNKSNEPVTPSTVVMQSSCASGSTRLPQLTEESQSVDDTSALYNTKVLLPRVQSDPKMNTRLREEQRQLNIRIARTLSRRDVPRAVNTVTNHSNRQWVALMRNEKSNFERSRKLRRRFLVQSGDGASLSFDDSFNRRPNSASSMDSAPDDSCAASLPVIRSLTHTFRGLLSNRDDQYKTASTDQLLHKRSYPPGQLSARTAHWSRHLTNGSRSLESNETSAESQSTSSDSKHVMPRISQMSTTTTTFNAKQHLRRSRSAAQIGNRHYWTVQHQAHNKQQRASPKQLWVKSAAEY